MYWVLAILNQRFMAFQKPVVD